MTTAKASTSGAMPRSGEATSKNFRAAMRLLGADSMARSNELRASKAASFLRSYGASIDELTASDKSIAARAIQACAHFLSSAIARSTHSIAFLFSPLSRNACANAANSGADCGSHTFSRRSILPKSCSIASAFNATILAALASAPCESVNGSMVCNANNESNPTRSNHAPRRARVVLLVAAFRLFLFAKGA